MWTRIAAINSTKELLLCCYWEKFITIVSRPAIPCHHNPLQINLEVSQCFRMMFEERRCTFFFNGLKLRSIWVCGLSVFGHFRMTDMFLSWRCNYTTNSRSWLGFHVLVERVWIRNWSSFSLVRQRRRSICRRWVFSRIFSLFCSIISKIIVEPFGGVWTWMVWRMRSWVYMIMISSGRHFARGPLFHPHQNIFYERNYHKELDWLHPKYMYTSEVWFVPGQTVDREPADISDLAATLGTELGLEGHIGNKVESRFPPAQFFVDVVLASNFVREVYPNLFLHLKHKQVHFLKRSSHIEVLNFSKSTIYIESVVEYCALWHQDLCLILQKQHKMRLTTGRREFNPKDGQVELSNFQANERVAKCI